MAVIWQACDEHMTSIWQAYGKHMTSRWQAYDKHMASIWQAYDKHMTRIMVHIRRSLGALLIFLAFRSAGTVPDLVHMEYEAYCKHMTSICQAYDKHNMTSIWQAYDKHMTGIWQAYGKHMTSIMVHVRRSLGALFIFFGFRFVRTVPDSVHME